MTGPNLLGFGQALAVCEPSCFTQIPIYNFGLGVVRSGSWILQDPLPGYSATEAYLPSEKVAIAAVVTYQPRPSTRRATTRPPTPATPSSSRSGPSWRRRIRPRRSPAPSRLALVTPADAESPERPGGGRG